MFNVQVTAYGRQTVPDWGVVRSCDPLQHFGAPITGTAEPKVVKFCTRVGNINSMQQDDILPAKRQSDPPLQKMLMLTDFAVP